MSWALPAPHFLTSSQTLVWNEIDRLWMFLSTHKIAGPRMNNRIKNLDTICSSAQKFITCHLKPRILQKHSIPECKNFKQVPEWRRTHQCLFSKHPCYRQDRSYGRQVFQGFERFAPFSPNCYKNKAIPFQHRECLTYWNIFLIKFAIYTQTWNVSFTFMWMSFGAFETWKKHLFRSDNSGIHRSWVLCPITQSQGNRKCLFICPHTHTCITIHQGVRNKSAA